MVKPKPGTVRRVGLIATQGIRGSDNRVVLERIKETGDIFFAISTQEWTQEGASVNVSMVGFDDGTEQHRILDGKPVTKINTDLTSGVDVTKAQRLVANISISFMGDSKGGEFNISNTLTQEFLSAGNPNGKPNSDVVRPWVNGSDLLKRPLQRSIIDFGTKMPQAQAALYEAPFEYVKRHVKPARDKNNRKSYKERWWLHVEPRPKLRQAMSGLKRFLATTRHSKYRIFSWLSPKVLPDSALIVFARDDDYFCGVLQSKIHKIWSLRKGTRLQTRSRYTPKTTFETFPFPWILGNEPKVGQVGYDKVEAIALAALELNAKREQWLGSIEERIRPGARSMTELYNQQPQWLLDAHAKLDHAVFNAYGWSLDLADEEVLRRLLVSNSQQPAVGKTSSSRGPDKKDRRDGEIAKMILDEIADNPKRLVSGKKLKGKLDDLLG